MHSFDNSTKFPSLHGFALKSKPCNVPEVQATSLPHIDNATGSKEEKTHDVESKLALNEALNSEMLSALYANGGSSLPAPYIPLWHQRTDSVFNKQHDRVSKSKQKFDKGAKLTKEDKHHERSFVINNVTVPDEATQKRTVVVTEKVALPPLRYIPPVLRNNKNVARRSKTRQGETSNALFPPLPGRQQEELLARPQTKAAPGNEMQDQKFVSLFRQLDVAERGWLSVGQVHECLLQRKETLGPEFVWLSSSTRERLQFVLMVLDVDTPEARVGERDFSTALALLQRLQNTGTRRKSDPFGARDLNPLWLADHVRRFKQLFRMVDRQGRGRITREQLRDLLIGKDPVLNEGASAEGGVDELIQAMPQDSEGTVTFLDFLAHIPYFLELHHRTVTASGSIR
eukprot:Colp12_sorted_trinity150504_noHs@8389